MTCFSPRRAHYAYYAPFASYALLTASILRACETMLTSRTSVPVGRRQPGRHPAGAAGAPGRYLVGQATLQERRGQRGAKVVKARR